MKNTHSIIFPLDKIRLKRIYQSKDVEYENGQSHINPKIEEIYGDFTFPPFSKNRAYTLGSFVQSIDGKIAFPESPDGTLVAKGNLKDQNGALADYWILNLLRAVCDGVLMGSRTIAREPELTGKILDPDLVSYRLSCGKPAIPLHIIVSGRGTEFPINHRIFKDPDIPVLIVTTDEGKRILTKSYAANFDNFSDLDDSCSCCIKGEIKSIISLGKKNRINLIQLLSFLKKNGLEKVMIESPQFLVSLMKEGLLDELYLNTSSIFIGGDALSIGRNLPSFSFNNHPYGKLISMHTHSDYFYYLRYRMEYDLPKQQGHTNLNA